MSRVAEQDGWIILRCNGSRTLPLAAALSEAGIGAWAPVQWVKRRVPRAKNRREVKAPLLPTFVFAPADRLADLLRMAADPMKRHPAFSVFRRGEAVPVISDASLADLRRVHEQSQRQHAKGERRTVPVGASVRPQEGAWAGLTGTVTAVRHANAVVDFGGGFVVTIASYLLPDTMLLAPSIAA